MSPEGMSSIMRLVKKKADGHFFLDARSRSVGGHCAGREPRPGRMVEQGDATTRPAARCSGHRDELALGVAVWVGVDAPPPNQAAQAQACERREGRGHQRREAATQRKERSEAQGLPGLAALSHFMRFSQVAAAESAAATAAAVIIEAKVCIIAAAAARHGAGRGGAAANAAAAIGADGRRGSLEASSLVAIVGRFALDAAREARAAAP